MLKTSIETICKALLLPNKPSFLATEPNFFCFEKSLNFDIVIVNFSRQFLLFVMFMCLFTHSFVLHSACNKTNPGLAPESAKIGRSTKSK